MEKIDVSHRSRMPIMAIAVAAVAASGGACSKLTHRTVELGGVSYTIPSDHIETIKPPGTGRVYVRVIPPGVKFTLVLAESSRHARNWQGGETPLVTHINDVPGRKLEAFNFAGGKTVCRGDIPQLSCGLRIGDVEAGWSVLFDRDQLKDSEAIRTDALRFVSRY